MNPHKVACHIMDKSSYIVVLPEHSLNLAVIKGSIEFYCKNNHKCLFLENAVLDCKASVKKDDYVQKAQITSSEIMSCHLVPLQAYLASIRHFGMNR